MCESMTVSCASAELWITPKAQKREDEGKGQDNTARYLLDLFTRVARNVLYRQGDVWHFISPRFAQYRPQTVTCRFTDDAESVKEFFSRVTGETVQNLNKKFDFVVACVCVFPFWSHG